MEINANKPIGSSVQGLENASKVSEVKREKEESPKRQALQADENPGYRISLSNSSKKAVSELTENQVSGNSPEKGELSEQGADVLAQQVSEQLALTNATLSNGGIQKAIDLFM